MHSEQNKELIVQIDKNIEKIKNKMKLQNFNNLRPPFFIHTFTKYRQIYLSQFLKNFNPESTSSQQLRDQLKIIHYIIQNFDDECIQAYSSQLIEPYTKKIFQQNYGLDSVDLKDANTIHGINSHIQQVLSTVAEWFINIEITEDLLSRVQLYYKLDYPNILQKIRQQGLKQQKISWYDSFMSSIKRMMCSGLKVGSNTIHTAFMSALLPSALMLTFAIIGGSSVLPIDSIIDDQTVITSLFVIFVPKALNFIASDIQKSDVVSSLRRASETFNSLSQSITKFNQILEEALRNCTITHTYNQFIKQKTNLQKIVNELSKNINLVVKFDQKKVEEMRQRTQAYFKEYIQVEDGQWTIVLPKQEQKKYKEK